MRISFQNKLNDFPEMVPLLDTEIGKITEGQENYRSRLSRIKPESFQRRWLPGVVKLVGRGLYVI